MFRKILCMCVVCLSCAATLLADPYEGMLEKSIHQAENMGIKISVAIVDQHGNLVAFRRMEGAVLASVKFSQGKALTSATIPMSTAEIADMNATIPGMPFGNVPEFVLLKGGVPIFSETGEPIGAIGVGGGSGDQDELCAKAALK